MSSLTPRKHRSVRLVALAAASLVAVAGCSSSGDDATDAASADAKPAAVKTLRLGFFPNLTHAPALVGLQDGLFKQALKPLGLTVTPTAFNAGPDAVTALFGGSLDITYIGPNPTINAYAESGGEAVRVIAGAASGGAALVVNAGDHRRRPASRARRSPPRSWATPRTWPCAPGSSEQGLTSDTEGGGDVSIVPQANAEGLTAYSSGQIDGAWVPEPWVSEYVKAGAKVLVDEATLWPDGKFVTTNVHRAHGVPRRAPGRGRGVPHRATSPRWTQSPTTPKEAAEAANASLKSLTGSSLEPDVLDRRLRQACDFTADPLPATLKESADRRHRGRPAGPGDKVDAAGGLPGTLYDLTLLNEVLAAAGEPDGGHAMSRRPGRDDPRRQAARRVAAPQPSSR